MKNYYVRISKIKFLLKLKLLYFLLCLHEINNDTKYILSTPLRIESTNNQPYQLLYFI